MSSGAMDSGEGAVQPAPIDPLVSEISQTVPEVVTGVSEIERTAAKINTTIDHDVSEDIKPSNQGDTCRETEEEGVSVSMQANREMEFVKKPGEFTTEVFKIEIRNLPRYAGYKQLRKRLVGLGLKPVKIKMMPNDTYAFVTFRCEEDRKAALEGINGHEFKKRILEAKVAKATLDPIRKKREHDGTEEDSGCCKVAKIEEELSIPPSQRLSDATTPLWNIPYEEQLKMKMTEAGNALVKIAKVVEKNQPEEWFKQHRSLHGGSLCQLEEIIPSPVKTGYRNKCEFTIGLGTDGKGVIGFRLASYKDVSVGSVKTPSREDGNITVLPPYDCIHVSDRAKEIVKAFQLFIDQSDLPVLNPVNLSGYWRSLTVRTCNTGEDMVVMVIHPQELTKEDLEKQKVLLAEYFTTGPGVSCSLASLYFQPLGQRIIFSINLSPYDEHQAYKQLNQSGATPDYQFVCGSQYVHEKLMGLTFRISPSAFFQVNTAAAERLYSVIGDWCGVKDNTVLFDICCGTGSIGLTMAKSVSQVVGIEMVEQAVKDAEVNAKENSISNTCFLCGKAEDTLPELLNTQKMTADHVIGVVDPPRAGLHQRVVQAIRRSPLIQKIIFVSCNIQHSGVTGNIVDLCRMKSNRFAGLPFRPMRAIVVDMFPHTRHFELIMELQRLTQSEVEASESSEKLTTST